MIRTIGATVVGYIIMVIGAVFGFMVAWAILGAEGAFQANTTIASGPWTLISFVVRIGGGRLPGPSRKSTCVR